MSEAKSDSIVQPVPAEVSATPAPRGDGNEFARLFQRLGELVIYPPGTKLFSQGLPIRDICLIEAGMVKFTRTDQEGREVIVALRTAGKLLGAAAAVSRNVALVNTVTLTECRIYRLSAALFLKQMETGHGFLLYLNQTICQQFYEQMEQLARVSVTPARARLAQFLFQLAVETVPLPDRTLKLQLPYSQVTVAGWLAIKPEYLSRLLKELEKDGVIRRSKSWIYVPNLDRLTAEAT